MMKKGWIWIAILGFIALAGIVRQVSVTRGVAQALSAAQMDPLQDFGSTRTLEIFPLDEAVAARADLQTEKPAVSYLVRTDQATILFDVGANSHKASPSPVEHNLQALGVSLDDVDLVVISHPHYDHTGGGRWLSQNTFSLGNAQIPLNVSAVYTPIPMTYPGLSPQVVQAPQAIASGVALTGTMPFTMPFPFSLYFGKQEEQSLLVNVEGVGVVIITGCGHPGVDPIVSRAQALVSQPIVGMVGGLHLGSANADQLQPQIQRLQSLPLRLVALSPHDTGTSALQAFQAAFPAIAVPIQVGSPIRLNSPSIDG